MTPAEAAGGSRAFLVFPHGPTSWFNGRILSGGGAALSLMGVLLASQHACLCPSDGSHVAYDCAVIDHRAHRVALVEDVSKTGGTVPSLSSPLLEFAASTCHFGGIAARLARAMFPEVLTGDEAGDELIVVEGVARLGADALEWRGMGAASGAAPEGAGAADADAVDGDAILRRLAGRRAVWAHAGAGGDAAADAGDDAAGVARAHSTSGGAAPCDLDAREHGPGAGARSCDARTPGLPTEADADGWISAPRRAARATAGSGASQSRSRNGAAQATGGGNDA